MNQRSETPQTANVPGKAVMPLNIGNAEEKCTRTHHELRIMTPPNSGCTSKSRSNSLRMTAQPSCWHLTMQDYDANAGQLNIDMVRNAKRWTMVRQALTAFTKH